MRVLIPVEVTNPAEQELYTRLFRAGYLDLRHPERLKWAGPDMANETVETLRALWPEAYDAGVAQAFKDMNMNSSRPQRK